MLLYEDDDHALHLTSIAWLRPGKRRYLLACSKCRRRIRTLNVVRLSQQFKKFAHEHGGDEAVEALLRECPLIKR